MVLLTNIFNRIMRFIWRRNLGIIFKDNFFIIFFIVICIFLIIEEKRVICFVCGIIIKTNSLIVRNRSRPRLWVKVHYFSFANRLSVNVKVLVKQRRKHFDKRFNQAHHGLIHIFWDHKWVNFSIAQKRESKNWKHNRQRIIACLIPKTAI